MPEQRKPISAFIKSAWTNMNIRAGKYRHLGTKVKNRCYVNVRVVMTRAEFRDWCLARKAEILALKRPSVDRVDNNGDYSLANIRVIELKDNIKKKRYGGPSTKNRSYW